MRGCSFVTQYNSSLSSFVPNFRILTQVVAEKSLTEKKKFTNKQTDRQTNIITEKAKAIYPLNTLYRGYKDQKLVFKSKYHLMHVKSIAEWSKGIILQYFRPSLSYHLSLSFLLCLFLSGRLRQVLL